MKHKHYDIGVAKLADTTLVKFVKLPSEWVATTTDEWNIASDYFLCLPQHKEFCLHWLNGGDVQDFFEGEWSDCASLAHATEVGGDNTLEFSMHHMFMNEEFNFRIAPKKEKRVVVYDEAANKFEETAFKNIDEAKEEIGYSDAQFIEIEVELTSK